MNPGASLTYLTGLSFHLMERPVVLIYVSGQEPVLILPELEKVKLESLPFACQTYFFGDNPIERTSAFQMAAANLKLGWQENSCRTNPPSVHGTGISQGISPIYKVC